MNTGPYADPANDGADWFPTSDQQSSLAYQGSVAVPDLCDGGQLSLEAGGSFTAQVKSTSCPSSCAQ